MGNAILYCFNCNTQLRESQFEQGKAYRFDTWVCQVHQKHVNLPSPPSDQWQEIVLKVQDLVGGEHWAGANDGKWHPAAKALGINIGPPPR